MGRPAARSMGAFGTLLGLGVVATLGASTPACIFPEFTFDESTGGTGGGTTTTTTTSEGGGGSTTTSHSTSMSTGGGGTTTSSTEGGGGTTTTSSTEGGGGTGGGGNGGGGAGGGGSGGGTTSSTTTSTTSTPPPVEDCTNGVDDDGDGLVDCKDLDDCEDYSCVPSVPGGGWTGYFLLYEGTLAQDPFCTKDFPTENYVGSNALNAPPAQCAACSCSAPQGEVCQPSPLVTVADAPCGNSPTYTGPMNMPGGWTGTCSHPLNPMTGLPFVWSNDFECGPDNLQQCNVSISGAAPTVQGGVCTSSGGQATITPATWQGFGRACGGVETTGKGCNINQVCLPKPPTPFVGGICIKKAGDNTCPSGVSLFDTKHVFYENFTDSRTCQGCSCGGVLGSTCAGSYSVFSDTQVNVCSQLATTFDAGTCKNFPGNPVVGPVLFTQTMAPTGGSCAAVGGMPLGQATPTFPTTFCCIE